MPAIFVRAKEQGTYTPGMPKKTPDNDWFMQQVELEQSGLRGFIRMLGVRPESVDDIAQETFVVAYKKLTMFERGTNFGAWLRTIARNLVRNELRRQGRRRVLANEVAEFLLSRADEKATHPSAEVEQAEQRERQVAALRDCLRELPERSRRLVQQRYFEQLSLGVIAAYENTNANNVSQILFRLRAALFNCIQERLGNVSG
jgi:RNA polymerase sigma-70 factor (ECF subfamily)